MGRGRTHFVNLTAVGSIDRAARDTLEARTKPFRICKGAVNSHLLFDSASRNGYVEAEEIFNGAEAGNGHAVSQNQFFHRRFVERLLSVLFPICVGEYAVPAVPQRQDWQHIRGYRQPKGLATYSRYLSKTFCWFLVALLPWIFRFRFASCSRWASFLYPLAKA